MSGAVVEQARRALGRVGAMLPVTPADPPPMAVQRTAARRLEAAGYTAAWTNEVIGKDALVQVAMLLEATERMVFGTCIANIWARPAQTAHAAGSQLAEAYPGRFVLGLGVGYPPQAEQVGRHFGKSLATMSAYLAEAANPGYVRIVAANKPKMLALARDESHGALPALPDPASTAAARAALGPDKLLVVYLDATGQAFPGMVREHLDAGADHCIAGTPFGAQFTPTIDNLIVLAPELTALNVVGLRNNRTESGDELGASGGGIEYPGHGGQ